MSKDTANGFPPLLWLSGSEVAVGANKRLTKAEVGGWRRTKKTGAGDTCALEKCMLRRPALTFIA
jgi:hypothetical protein